jgi:hypothetical protein
MRPALFLSLAIGVLFSWPTLGEGPTPAPPKGGMKVKTGMAEVAEPVLYYEECGEGEAVVLIHGGLEKKDVPRPGR